MPLPLYNTLHPFVTNSNILLPMLGCIRYSWRWLKPCILLVLICSSCTILLGLVEGVFLGQWFLRSSHDTTRFLVQDTVSARAYSWFSVPGRAGFLDAIIRPYYIQQLRNPTDWVDKLGLKRPTNWDTQRLEQLASLGDLYRRRRLYSDAPPWHHWIYASAQSEPMEGDVDEWDRAFDELLRHRDKYEYFGRANFHYVACPRNFLCNAWRITGPALLHFTTELPPQAEAADKSEAKRTEMEIMPNHDPVTVRLFELPLRDPVLPGVFPSRFEQMRSITGNLSFWSSQEPYSEALQFFRQAKKLYGSIAKLHPRTYGALVKIEEHYLKLLGLSESQALGRIQLISTGVSALSTIVAVRTWKLVGTVWGVLLGQKAKQGSKVVADGSQHVTGPASNDPVARMLQEFVDELTEEQEKSLMEDPTGSQILSKIRTALDENNFDSKDEVLGGIMNALGKDPDGKTKHST
ncbi:hypothetical protein N0V84_012445 [Fusarium piperis]|uniref:Uncharacterized protein n=1 Tax=Fusarium piperis TaxID=1435070 RepID=A0A9W8TBK7_9HYPO|nr:hypothetical protein N0V84_012445 [Fusarium piperis]